MANASPAAKAAVMPEIELETPALMAISRAMGAQCRPQNEAYLECKAGNARPGACLTEGRNVTRCALDLFEKTEKNCEDVFTEYAGCFEKTNFRYERCRKQQSKFEACIGPHIQDGPASNRRPVDWKQ